MAQIWMGLLLAALSPAGDKPSWMKWDAAKELSKKTGLPIVVYSTVDQKGGGCWGGSTDTDRAFGEEVVVKRYKDFIYVKCGDKKTAEEVKAKNPPEVIFFDPDGEEIARMPVKTAGDVDRAMTEALKKYGPREIAWASYDPEAVKAARESGKLVVLVFASDSKDTAATLEAFTDRTLAKLHEKIAFFKIEFRKDGEVEKLWGATSAPTVITVDGQQEPGSKATIEKALGKKSPSSLKAMIVKGLKQIEKS